MTERQWQVMAKAVAELCRRYRNPVTPKTVLGHGEVQQNLGIPQRGKWDPLILPWKAHPPRQKVGTLLRNAVAAALDGTGPRPDPSPRPDPETPTADETAPLRAVVNGTPLPHAVSFDEGAYLKLSSLADVLKWRVVGADTDLAVVALGPGRAELAYLGYLFRDDRDLDDADEDELVRQVRADAYVGAVQVARTLRLPIAFDFETERLVIGKGAAQAAQDPARRPLQGSFVTVKPGETLFRIAERHLGNGNRWRQLRKADGRPYTEADLPLVRIGEIVLLPDAPAAKADVRPASRPAELDVERLIAAAPPELQSFAKRSIPVIVAECLARGVTRPAQIA